MSREPGAAREPASGPGPGGASGRSAFLGITGAVIVCLVILAIVRAVQGNGSVARPAARPAAIAVLNENTVSFRLRHAAGALLDVRYLRADHGPASIWLTLAASGLPKRIEFVAAAGDCNKGIPRTLAISSGRADPATDLLMLSLDHLHGSESTTIWVSVASTSGVRLGGVRGTFLQPGSQFAIPPGGPPCG